MQEATTLRKGDLVQVMVGRSRGKSGKILRVDNKRARIYVEKLNVVKRHMKPGKKHPQGGVIEKESSLHWSNAMLVCAKCTRPVRVRHKIDGEKKIRVCAKCGEKV